MAPPPLSEEFRRSSEAVEKFATRVDKRRKEKNPVWGGGKSENFDATLFVGRKKGRAYGSTLSGGEGQNPASVRGATPTVTFEVLGRRGPEVEHGSIRQERQGGEFNPAGGLCLRNLRLIHVNPIEKKSMQK